MDRLRATRISGQLIELSEDRGPRGGTKKPYTKRPRD
jgi:hypothetical protein